MDKDYRNFVGRMGSSEEDMSINTNELTHYGVPGMKWGRRKATQIVDAIKNHKAKKIATYSEDHHHELTSQKNPATLSDAEIKQAIARMNLEVQYRNLKRQNVSEGKRLAMSILDTQTKTTATRLITTASKAAKFA